MYKMSVSYNKLWKLLVDKKMSKADLRRAAGMAPNTLTCMRKEETVSTAILLRICGCLDCNIGDIMDVIKTETPDGKEITKE